MKLNDRQIRLIKLMVSQPDYQSIRYFSNGLKVSERTIQNDFKDIEKIDSKKILNIERRPNVGVLMKNSLNEVKDFLS